MNRILEYITKPQIIKSIYLLMVIMLVCNIVIFADPSDPNGTDPDAPIDGGLSLLVAAGVGYGVKKLKEKKQQKDTDVLDK